TLRKACDTTGTETADGYMEAAYNLDVARRLARILRAAGAPAVLTRTTNDGGGPWITTRAAIGNRGHGDVPFAVTAHRGPASATRVHLHCRASDGRAHRRHLGAVETTCTGGARRVPRRHARTGLDLRRTRRHRRSFRPRRAQPLGRSEGADRDREHAQRVRRG